MRRTPQHPTGVFSGQSRHALVVEVVSVRLCNSFSQARWVQAVIAQVGPSSLAAETCSAMAFGLLVRVAARRIVAQRRAPPRFAGSADMR
jgi:hypothetical protein